MKTFYKIIGNTLVVSITTFFVWFATAFWIYLQTKSVLATSISSAVFMGAMALSGFWLGSIVDHHKKKRVMVVSTIISIVFFAIALITYVSFPPLVFTTLSSPYPWIVIACVLVAFLASNIRAIALPTLTTMLIPIEHRDKANGLSGMVMGASSMAAGIASGLVLAYAGLGWVFGIAIVISTGALIHLMTIEIPEKEIVRSQESALKKLDIKGTIAHIRSVRGLFPLIFFTTFNNLLGGVFAALMDPYGLSLVSVQTWGVLWGILSSGFILGGLYIAKKGLGKDPLRNLFRINMITWISCIFFAIQPSVLLMCVGIFTWVCLAPFIEATEQTVIQKVVPVERQGRVFGFAQSIEMAASPLMSFLTGPIAQFIFIPFMTVGAGVSLIGGWFGTGPGRGIALIFIIAGIIGFLITQFARRSKAYRILAEQYQKS